MRQFLFIGLAALTASCAPEAEPGNDELAEVSSNTIDCGEIVELKVVSKLLSRLGDVARAERITDEDKDIFRFPLTIKTGGKSKSISFQQIRDDTESYISFEDFRHIAGTRADDVQSGGYRGCFLAHGKVWFELPADGNNLQLMSFDKDMKW